MNQKGPYGSIAELNTHKASMNWSNVVKKKMGHNSSTMIWENDKIPQDAIILNYCS